MREDLIVSIKLVIGVQRAYEALDETIMPGPHEKAQRDQLRCTRDYCMHTLVEGPLAHQVVECMRKQSLQGPIKQPPRL